MSAHKRRHGFGVEVKRRRLRSRPTPEWLVNAKDLDEMAKRRCLMVLSVLSGSQPVTEAITEAKISRGTYYQLETRALRAMLQALLPGNESTGGGEGTATRLLQMERKISHLEKEKRRSERLLYLTRQVLKPGAVSSGKGPRPSRKRRSSTSPGRKPSTSSKVTSPSTSTPLPTGQAAP